MRETTSTELVPYSTRQNQLRESTLCLNSLLRSCKVTTEYTRQTARICYAFATVWWKFDERVSARRACHSSPPFRIHSCPPAGTVSISWVSQRLARQQNSRSI